MAEKTEILTVDGIELPHVDDSIGDDWEVVELLAELNDDDADPMDRMGAIVNLSKHILGEDYKRVKTILKDRNDGKLSAEAMEGFVGAVFSALGTDAKN